MTVKKPSMADETERYERAARHVGLGLDVLSEHPELSSAPPGVDTDAYLFALLTTASAQLVSAGYPMQHVIDVVGTAADLARFKPAAA